MGKTKRLSSKDYMFRKLKLSVRVKNVVAKSKDFIISNSAPACLYVNRWVVFSQKMRKSPPARQKMAVC
jgi:hypothetical protein